MPKYQIYNNSGYEITICIASPNHLECGFINGRREYYFTDLIEARKALQVVAEKYPTESKRPGGFTLRVMPEVIEARIVARVTYTEPVAGGFTVEEIK